MNSKLQNVWHPGKTLHIVNVDIFRTIQYIVFRTEKGSENERLSSTEICFSFACLSSTSACNIFSILFYGPFMFLDSTNSLKPENCVSPP